MNPSELLARFRERWSALSQVQKAVTVLAVVGILITLVYLGQLILSPTYAPLFTDLDPKEAGKMAEVLKEMKVPYRIAGEGKIIEVPEKQVYDVRIKLASDGLLNNNGVGFELFDEKKFGVTEFEQQVGYQRALQEELRRTIVQLDAVEQARVHLVIPKQSLFLEDEVNPSASIALKLKPTVKLEPEQVQGIVDLVMGSVQGMQPESIHIIDMEGNVLSDNIALTDQSAKMTRMTMDQFQIKRNYEKEMETRIQQMLRRILGPNKAVAMVTADLNFDQQQSSTTTYDPNKQVLSENTVSEQGTGSGASGNPGTDSSQPGSTLPAQDGNSGSNYSREETTTNYQVGNTQETVVKSPGDLQRLSVAVVVNGSFPQSELKEIENVVKAAIGYDQQRQDQVTISNMNFDDSELVDSAKAMAAETAGGGLAQQINQSPWMLPIAGLLTAIVIVSVILARRRRARKRNSIVEIPTTPDPVNLETSREPFIPETKQTASRQQELRDFAQENPQEVAEVIKLWMKE